eukprot:12431485-Karenia_brevis.AAC.1
MTLGIVNLRGVMGETPETSSPLYSWPVITSDFDFIPRHTRHADLLLSSPSSNLIVERFPKGHELTTAMYHLSLRIFYTKIPI